MVGCSIIRLMRYLLIGSLLFGIWLLFIATITPAAVILGIAMSSLSVLLFKSAIIGDWTDEPRRHRSLSMWLKSLTVVVVFLPVFGWKMLISGLGIALLALMPSISFWPGIVRTRLQLPSLSGATVFSNLITLTPGTMSLDYIPESDTLFIHWIDVSEYHADTVDEQVTGGMRAFLQRIFT